MLSDADRTPKEVAPAHLAGHGARVAQEEQSLQPTRMRALMIWWAWTWRWMLITTPPQIIAVLLHAYLPMILCFDEIPEDGSPQNRSCIIVSKFFDYVLDHGPNEFVVTVLFFLICEIISILIIYWLLKRGFGPYKLTLVKKDAL